MPEAPVVPRAPMPAGQVVSAFGRPVSAPLQGTESAKDAVGRVSYTHDAMIDLLISSGGRITQNELAKHFGYTPPWVSRIVNSDAFQLRLAARKADLADPSILLTIEEKLKALVSDSLDVLVEKLSLTKSTDIALKGLEIGAKALGYGARQNNVNVQHSFVVAMPTPIADQAAWAQKHGGAEDAIEVSSRTLDERLAEAEAAQRKD